MPVLLLAYAALQVLRGQGLPLAPDAIRDGLRAVRWPGRFEIIQREPYLVLDGAHNRDSAEKLATAVRDCFHNQPVTLIFGASSDKDVRGMLAELLAPGNHVRRVLFTQAVHPRAQDPEELAGLAEGYGLKRAVAGSVEVAVERALGTVGPEDVIVACGSLFVVAEARSASPVKAFVSDFALEDAD